MQWYINDASLQSQFEDANAFASAIKELLQARARAPRLKTSLYTSRTLSQMPVTRTLIFRDAISQINDRDFLRQVLVWFDRSGPFLDDDRYPEADDYFECLGFDVTDQGLGEAARRIKNQLEAGTFSFRGAAVDFSGSPLCVEHGLPGDRQGQYFVLNESTVDRLFEWALRAEPEPDSWRSMIERARLLFPLLIVSDRIFLDSRLAGEPFEKSIGDRAMELFRHLNQFVESRNMDGSETDRSRELIRSLFTEANGSVPIFTGESVTNQRNFVRLLTFPDPEDENRTVFAHWHGKIRHRFFRMHFEWPMPREARRLKVVYLGPKLTKE
jgi:hypothetical protein